MIYLLLLLIFWDLIDNQKQVPIGLFGATKTIRQALANNLIKLFD